jgi:hypothetical protein
MIDDAIDAIEDERCQVVIRLKYIKRASWVQIGRSMHCVVRTAHRIHGRALQLIKFEEKKA